MRHRKWWLAAILTMGGDVVTTWFALTKLTESFSEANPVVVGLADMIGLLPALLALKVGFTALMIGLYRWEDEGEKWHVLAIAAGFHALVTAWNAIQIGVVL
jgi:hypothetical protein